MSGSACRPTSMSRPFAPRPRGLPHPASPLNAQLPNASKKCVRCPARCPESLAIRRLRHSVPSLCRRRSPGAGRVDTGFRLRPRARVYALPQRTSGRFSTGARRSQDDPRSDGRRWLFSGGGAASEFGGGFGDPVRRRDVLPDRLRPPFDMRPRGRPRPRKPLLPSSNTSMSASSRVNPNRLPKMIASSTVGAVMTISCRESTTFSSENRDQ